MAKIERFDFQILGSLRPSLPTTTEPVVTCYVSHHTMPPPCFKQHFKQQEHHTLVLPRLPPYIQLDWIILSATHLFYNDFNSTIFDGNVYDEPSQFVTRYVCTVGCFQKIAFEYSFTVALDASTQSIIRPLRSSTPRLLNRWYHQKQTQRRWQEGDRKETHKHQGQRKSKPKRLETNQCWKINGIQ